MSRKKLVEQLDILEGYDSISIAEMIELLEAQQAKYPDSTISLEVWTEQDYYDAYACAKLQLSSYRSN
jgi:hypothetical protein